MRFPSCSFLPAVALLAGAISFPAAGHADSLIERQEKVTAAIAKTRPAVVAIQSKGLRGMGSGSGVIVSADGLILTAAHVVDAAAGRDGDDAREVSVVLPDGRELKGKVLGRDRGRDAAMVKITEGTDWPHADLAAADSVEPGEWCIAMGHPGGFDIQRGAPVRVGRLWLNNDKAFYRSDCTVSGGDSGGPLFDLDGKVIGIHSNISVGVEENRHVPVRVFHDDWERLKKGETWGDAKRLLADSDDLRPRRDQRPRVERKEPAREPEEPAVPAKGGAWLGIQVDGGPDGPLVQQILDASPAQKAGLQLEDVILKINGKAVGSTGDVKNRVLDSKPGDKLTFTVKRGDMQKDIEVTLAARE